MAVSVDMVKCACADCVCVFDAQQGVEAEGRKFCSDNCAGHHAAGAGCEHSGCACHG